MMNLHFLFLLCLVLALPVQAAWKDPVHGFTLSVPDGWRKQIQDDQNMRNTIWLNHDDTIAIGVTSIDAGQSLNPTRLVEIFEPIFTSNILSGGKRVEINDHIQNGLSGKYGHYRGPYKDGDEVVQVTARVFYVVKGNVGHAAWGIIPTSRMASFLPQIEKVLASFTFGSTSIDLSEKVTNTDKSEESVPQVQGPSKPKYENARITVEKSRSAPAVSAVRRDAKTVYCVADIVQAPPGTQLEGKWFYLGNKDGLQPRGLGKKTFITKADTIFIAWSLMPPEGQLFASGKYQLHLFIEDELQDVLDFTMRFPTTQEMLQQAQAGDVESQFGIYAYYSMGKLQGIGDQEAVQWLRKAANSGHALAQFNLGAIYLVGKHNIAVDKLKGVEWIRKAAQQQNEQAAYNLAVFYREGSYGVTRDMAKAMEWTRKAADYGSLEAQYNLGMHYMDGIGVPQDKSAAIKWLRKAADGGFAPAKEFMKEMSP